MRLVSLAGWLSLVLAFGCRAAAPQAKDSGPTPESRPSVAREAAPETRPDTGTATTSTATTSSLDVVDAGLDPITKAEPPPSFAKDNKVDPIQGADLDARAKALFDAIVRNDPAIAESFWFPEEPFLSLKDIKDPGKYWKQLHRTYANDVHALHKKRKSWEGATFVRFEGWSHPKWVKPGEEANKIGYFRAFHGKIRYALNGQEETIDVHTIITWQGRWFVTHLRKFKK